MSSFARGMQLGIQAWDDAETAKLRKEEMGLRKARDARDAELHSVTMDEKRREAAKQQELADIRFQTKDFIGGVDRGATNAALDADFEAANQAAAQGLQLPAVRGGSNAANEAALTVKNAVDPNSSTYQSGLSGLRAQYALASGDMKDFDNVQNAERSRVLMEQRRGELARIRAIPDDELAKTFGQMINPRADVPAMVGYDPKKKAFTFTSDIPGFPSQVLSRAEMESALMGLWEQGKGDYAAGVQAVLGTVQTQRGLDGQNFDRSLKLADAGATQDYRNRSLANDEARTAAYRANLGRGAQERADAMKAAQPYIDRFQSLSPEEQAGPVGQGLLRQASVAAAQKSGDINGVITGLTRQKTGGGLSKVTPGDMFRDANGNVWVTGEDGQDRLHGGIAPSQLPQFLESAGLPPQAEALVRPLADGRHVTVPDAGNMVFDIANQQDVAALKAAVERASRVRQANSQARPEPAPAPRAINPRTGQPYPAFGTNQRLTPYQ